MKQGRSIALWMRDSTYPASAPPLLPPPQVALLRFSQAAASPGPTSSSYALLAASAERSELLLVSLPQDPGPQGGLLRSHDGDDASGHEAAAALAFARSEARRSLHHHSARTHTLQLAGFAPPPPASTADIAEEDDDDGMIASAAARILPRAHTRIAVHPLHADRPCPTAASGGSCWPDSGYAVVVSDNAGARAGAILVEPPLAPAGDCCGCFVAPALGGAVTSPSSHSASAAAAAAVSQWHFKTFVQVRWRSRGRATDLARHAPRLLPRVQWPAPSPVQTASCSGPHLTAALRAAASRGELLHAPPLAPSFEVSATTLAGVETAVVPLAVLFSPTAEAERGASAAPPTPTPRAMPLLSPSAASAAAAAAASAAAAVVAAASSSPSTASPRQSAAPLEVFDVKTVDLAARFEVASADAAPQPVEFDAELLQTPGAALDDGTQEVPVQSAEALPVDDVPVTSAAPPADVLEVAGQAEAPTETWEEGEEDGGGVEDEEEDGGAGGAWPGPPTVAAAEAGVAGPPALPSDVCGTSAAAAEDDASLAPMAVGSLPVPPAGSSSYSSSGEGGDAGVAAHAVVSVLGSLADRLANDAAARDASLVAEQMLLLQVRMVWRAAMRVYSASPAPRPCSPYTHPSPRCFPSSWPARWQKRLALASAVALAGLLPRHSPSPRLPSPSSSLPPWRPPSAALLPGPWDLPSPQLWPRPSQALLTTRSCRPLRISPGTSRPRFARLRPQR